MAEIQNHRLEGEQPETIDGYRVLLNLDMLLACVQLRDIYRRIDRTAGRDAGLLLERNQARLKLDALLDEALNPQVVPLMKAEDTRSASSEVVPYVAPTGIIQHLKFRP